MNCKQENENLIYNFLKKSFKKKQFRIIEFQLNAICNLNCDYCYYTKNLNDSNIHDEEKILNNLDIILNYLYKNFEVETVSNFDVFSGEVLIQNIGIKILKKLIDFIHDKNLNINITVPTNGTFVNNDEKKYKVQDLINYSIYKGVSLFLSLSFDGKYMDYINRKGSIEYTDEYYEKLFLFAKEYKCGFHPMIHYNNIEQWKDNFLWFQEMFDKYNLKWNNIYLLEIRNNGWTTDKCKKFEDLIYFIMDLSYKNKFYPEKQYFVDNFIFKRNNMNILNNISKIDRGIGCSMQNSLQIKLKDLSVNPCHRLSYKEFNSFRFISNDNEIVRIEPKNIGVYFATRHFNIKNLPYCQDCLIKYICSGGCIGAQYEKTREMFIPIPSVCVLEHSKAIAQLKFLKNNNMFGYFISKLDKYRANSFIELNNMIEG